MDFIWFPLIELLISAEDVEANLNEASHMKKFKES